MCGRCLRGHAWDPEAEVGVPRCDGYLKKQWRMIAKGELGYIPAKHIVSALPEEGERP